MGSEQEEQPRALVELSRYPRDQYNVLVPTTRWEQISPFHQVRVAEVRLSPEPLDGDVFKVGSVNLGSSDKPVWETTFSLAKPAIMKLSMAAGIIWNWRETRVLSATPTYVCYQAIGAMRSASGEWITIKATAEIDLGVIEEELLLDYHKDAATYKKPEEWVQQQLHAAMVQWRKNKLHRAETKAMLRVVRALLAIPHRFTGQHLRRPFIVPSVVFAPDVSDPAVRGMLLEIGSRAMTDLFGAGTALPGAQGVTPLPLGAGAVLDADADGDTDYPNGSGKVEYAPEDAIAGTPAGSAAPPPPPAALHQAPPGPPSAGPAAASAPPVAGVGGTAATASPGASAPAGPTAPAGSGLFPQDSPEAAPAPGQATRRPAGSKAVGGVVAFCEGCGVGIPSAAVVAYSKKRWGQALCRDCQDALKRAQGGEGA